MHRSIARFACRTLPAGAPAAWAMPPVAALLVTLCMPQQAAAASFKVVATIPGGPQIGAFKAGMLYGTIAYTGNGVLFSIGANGTHYTVLHNFNGSTDGSAPTPQLALGAGGSIYGTATNGGAASLGTVWEYSPTAGMTTPHAFGTGVAQDGTFPLQGLARGPGGAFYGSTSQGAIGGSGNIFKVTQAGRYTVLYKFLSGADGHCPFSGVFMAADGTLYGTVVGRGFGGNPNGSVWKFTRAGGLQTLYIFQNANDGEWPDQAPVVDKAGNIYGTTHVQNSNNFAGAIWTISAAGQFSVLHDFVADTDGYGPNSPLLLNANGKLYGTTGAGGRHGYGTVFEITPAGAFSVIHDFANTGDGAQPTGNLVQSAGGTIYGGTAYGPVFRLVP
jgi:uncharacterized repeat protein (TIGR03803 family)